VARFPSAETVVLKVETFCIIELFIGKLQIYSTIKQIFVKIEI
jgi:hypothetical protein